MNLSLISPLIPCVINSGVQETNMMLGMLQQNHFGNSIKETYKMTVVISFMREES